MATSTVGRAGRDRTMGDARVDWARPSFGKGTGRGRTGSPSTLVSSFSSSSFVERMRGSFLVGSIGRLRMPEATPLVPDWLLLLASPWPPIAPAAPERPSEAAPARAVPFEVSHRSLGSPTGAFPTNVSIEYGVLAGRVPLVGRRSQEITHHQQGDP